VDTGVLVALVDIADQYHESASSFLETTDDELYIPTLVITEVTFMLISRLGTHAEVGFLADIVDEVFTVEPVNSSDWSRILQLVRQYRDLPLGTVDASIIAAAERLDIRSIATFDRRHFTVVRPTHVEAFELLP
jgi:predicted nucleic acid-binding protein